MPLHFRRVHEQWALGSSVGSGCSLLVNMLGLAEVRVTVVLATGVGWHTGLTGLTARAQWSAAPAPTDTSTHHPHHMAQHTSTHSTQLTSRHGTTEFKRHFDGIKNILVCTKALLHFIVYWLGYLTPAPTHRMALHT